MSVRILFMLQKRRAKKKKNTIITVIPLNGLKKEK